MAGKGKGYELKVQIGGEVESSFGKAFSKAERELATLYKFSRRTNQGFLEGVDRLDSFANKTFAVMRKGPRLLLLAWPDYSPLPRWPVPALRLR